MDFLLRRCMAVVLFRACSDIARSIDLRKHRGYGSDQTHAIAPQASVKIRNLDDNSTHTTISANSGSFEVPNPKAGRYTVSIVKEGFAENTVGSPQLDSRQTVRLEAHIDDRVSGNLRAGFGGGFRNEYGERYRVRHQEVQPRCGAADELSRRKR